MASQYHTTRRIEWADTDAAGIIHFSRYFCFMEEVEHEFLRSLELSCMMDVAGERITWPRRSATCEFLKPVRFEDVMDVHLTVTRRGDKSLTFGFVFAHDGVEVARGQVVTVCCRMQNHKLEAIPIPEFIRGRIEQFSLGSDQPTRE